MSELMELIERQLGDREVDQLGSAIGADSDGTRRAIRAALPILLAGLARNANASGDRAHALDQALTNDHDGSLLDDLGPLLGIAGALFGGERDRGTGGGGVLTGRDRPPSMPRALDGPGILEHILGGRREPVERGVGKASGLDSSQIAKLLPLLAPIVMAALGRVKRDQGLGAEGVARQLEHERRTVERKSGIGDLITGILDADDDGSVLDDLGRLISRS